MKETSMFSRSGTLIVHPDVELGEKEFAAASLKMVGAGKVENSQSMQQQQQRIRYNAMLWKKKNSNASKRDEKFPRLFYYSQHCCVMDPV